ncbi:hypothetical protein P7C73_g3219, partial [Tremellales sp. Uapishka_1]
MDTRLIKRTCTYHAGDDSGRTYDSNGKVCQSLSSSDKISIAAALGFCGVVLLVLASIYVYRWRRVKQSSRQGHVVPERPMSSLGTPLMGSRRSRRPPSQPPSSIYPASLAPLSPLSSNSSEFHPLETSSTGSHSPNSLYSPNPESFHFPILSADGHLLPSPLASRRSWIDASEPLASGVRPLPSPPTDGDVEQANLPKTPRKWDHQPTLGESPSPERVVRRSVVGLYSGIDLRSGGSLEILRDDYDIDTARLGSSPTVTRVNGLFEMYRPQSATFHQTFSAEGEDISEIDISSEGGHRRY